MCIGGVTAEPQASAQSFDPHIGVPGSAEDGADPVGIGSANRPAAVAAIGVALISQPRPTARLSSSLDIDLAVAPTRGPFLEGDEDRQRRSTGRLNGEC
jgi:hypothetical protein